MDREHKEISDREGTDSDDSEPNNEESFADALIQCSSPFEDSASLDEVEFGQGGVPSLKTENGDSRPSLMRCSTAPLYSSTSTDSSTRPSVLPICKTSNHGCKMVNVHTVAQLVRGEYAMSGIAHHLIDCRYPYEYVSGHVRTALNIYICSDLLEVIFTVVPVVSPCEAASFLNLGPHVQALLRGGSKDGFTQEEVPLVPSALPTQVIIFYCEFSSQRGPESGLFLRNVDRYLNCSRYPFLFYPHVYVMMDGYEAFYKEYPELCEPRGYLKMSQLEVVDRLFYYNKLTDEVSRVCTACLNNLKLYDIELSPSAGEVKEDEEELESKPHLRPVKSAPSGLLKKSSECILKQSFERNAIIKRCLQLVEHIIRKGKLVVEDFERQNGNIEQSPDTSSERLFRRRSMRTSSASTESDSSTQTYSTDPQNENCPMGLLNFSVVDEETPFTSRNDSSD